MPYPYTYLDVSNGFVTSDEGPIDARLVLTKQEMLEIDDNYYMPEVYLTMCIDDGRLYIYNANNPEDPETGRFKKFEAEGGKAPSAESGPESERPDAADANPGDKWYDPTTGETTVVEVDSEGNNQWVPLTPAAGEMMYDSTNGKILYFDGHEWKEVGGLNDTAVGDTAPSNPNPGDKWLDESQNPPVLKEYGEDGQWHNVTAKAGDMMYDATNDVVMYFDGTEWKPIGGGIEHQSSVSPSSAGTPGEIIYDETAGEYKTYEAQETGDTKGVWTTVAKVLECTTAEFNALDSNGNGLAWSQRHPDVVVFITD